MHNSMVLQELPTFVFDEDGDLIPCHGTALDDLVQSAASVSKIRVGSQNGKITTAMRELAGALQAIRRCREDDDFSHLCCAATEAYGEIRKNLRMRVLTGLSPDESTLVVVFASPWIGECLVRAKTGTPQPPALN
jgi:hypothetical protein